MSDESSGHWWFGGQHLYEVFLKPIYFGPAAENRLLGFLVIGYEIDDRLASQVSRIAASQVAFYYGDAVVKTTLTPVQEAELDRQRVLHVGVPERPGRKKFNWVTSASSLPRSNLPAARILPCA